MYSGNNNGLKTKEFFSNKMSFKFKYFLWGHFVKMSGLVVPVYNNMFLTRSEYSLIFAMYINTLLTQINSLIMQQTNLLGKINISLT
jgi:hypothetical protein